MPETRSGVNDWLPRVPADATTREASRVRIEQSRDAARCPLHGQDWRLCPHAG